MKEVLLDKLFDYGIAGLMLMCLLWFINKYIDQVRKDGRQDYDGVTKRLNSVEDFQKEKMSEAIDKSTVAIVQNTEVLAEVKNVIQHCKGVHN